LATLAVPLRKCKPSTGEHYGFAVVWMQSSRPWSSPLWAVPTTSLSPGTASHTGPVVRLLARGRRPLGVAGSAASHCAIRYLTRAASRNHARRVGGRDAEVMQLRRSPSTPLVRLSFREAQPTTTTGLANLVQLCRPPCRQPTTLLGHLKAIFASPVPQPAVDGVTTATGRGQRQPAPLVPRDVEQRSHRADMLICARWSPTVLAQRAPTGRSWCSGDPHNTT